MIEIHNADARDLLPTIPDGSVHCIVSDIPYRTISGGNSIGKNGLGAHGRPTGMLKKNDGKIFEHNDIDITEYAADLFRVLPEQGHAWIFSNEKNRRHIEDAMLAVGFQTHFLGAWIKNTVNPNRWGMKNGELIYLFRKGPARALYNPSLKQFIHHDNIRGKTHETEKPVALMRDLVEASALPGDVVMDPFMGTGATAVACRDSGRWFIGCEIDAGYCDVARQRLRELPL